MVNRPNGLKPSRPLPAVQTTMWRARDGSLHDSEKKAVSHLLSTEIETALRAGGADGYLNRAVVHLLSHFHVWRIGDPSPVPTPATTEPLRPKEVCRTCLLATGFLCGAAMLAAIWWTR